MHTVCETREFQRAAEEAGMSRPEVEEFTDFVACNPEAGDEMSGTGGCRKVRVAGRGKGKRGGYRVVTFFTGPNLPIFLITVFGKGEKSNLTDAECNALSKLTKVLVTEYESRVTSVRAPKEGRT